jgi:hypothetical protein
MQQRRNRSIALLAGSLAVLVVVPTAWALSQPDDVVGSRPSASTPPATGPSAALEPTEAPSPVPAAPQVAGPEVPRIGVEVAPQPDLPLPPLPTQLIIPSVRINAAVAPTGVLADGQVDVPKDAKAVGWYEYGVRPGWPVGSSVIVGHVDSRTQGRGAMYPLKGVQVGDPVSVVREDGSRLEYRIVSRESIDKGVLPTGELFSINGPERLTLITCGGAYIPAAGGYQENVVVTAVRA